MGLSTLCVTMRLDRIGHLPCNCSIGGPAKGHLAREVDALGGEMGIAADFAATHIRRVGTSKGPSVQTVRAHVCKELYPKRMQQTLAAQENLDLLEGVVETGLTQGGRIRGIRLEGGQEIGCRALVLTTGTFLNGLCHEGAKKTVAARHGDRAATSLSDFLRDTGVRLRRFKTGTTPRVHLRSLNLSNLAVMESEPEAGAISFLHTSVQADRPLLDCYQTHTNAAMHALIRDHLGESAMYGGHIEGIGPRYCPSIEDKVVRFAEKDSHPIFLEIEDWGLDSVYVQGVSTSLPAERQIEMLRLVEGMEQVELIRPGYAVEYDMADPLQLQATLESKLLPGLFLAGQVNGTSGYEEAAAQGIVAGINAARLAAEAPPVEFSRDRSFLGVMIDDLVTKGVEDPYRMLTARAEHRLYLRHDNADERLTPISIELGLASESRRRRFETKSEQVERGIKALGSVEVSAAHAQVFEAEGLRPQREKITLFELLKRPDVDLAKALSIARSLGIEIELSDDREARSQIALRGLYGGYLKRQAKLTQQAEALEGLRIPEGFDFGGLRGLSYESREKLSRVGPRTIGQASRVPGVRMSDVALLIGAVRSSKG